MHNTDYETDLRAWKRRFWLAIAIYFITLSAGVAILRTFESLPTWAPPLAALASFVPAAIALIGGARFGSRHDGVELVVLHRSTSMAFIGTMVGCVSLGLVEAFVRTPPISAWWIYGFGMLAWVVASRVMTRQLA